ncbi:MAG TPA: arginine repressor [Oscillospiraceae bacterium]|nr:arginine repressor [Oscillospiraceae bacterium]HPS35232.1 arginine repressor [Oscillospiraceae bacterium]
MKNKRQERILELIASKEIQTQDDLLKMLNDSGYNVTQATVSRDIKELKLVKVTTSNGKYRYSVGTRSNLNEPESRFISMCEQNAITSDFAGNICVIRCLSGTANAICAAMDVARNDIVGTIAGDDTIFILFKTPQQAEDFSAHILRIISE